MHKQLGTCALARVVGSTYVCALVIWQSAHIRRGFRPELVCVRTCVYVCVCVQLDPFQE